MTRNKTLIVAELSANHNNDIELARKTIGAMAEAGADAVKVQTYTPDSLSLDVDNEFFGPKKDGLWSGRKPYELYQEACMPYEWQPGLKEYAESLGLMFFSSPFDAEGVDFLASMDIPVYKIASPEITDIPLIRYVARQGKPVMISTGMADFADLEAALRACREEGNTQVSFLKCTSEYPARIEEANLATISDLRERLGVRVGVSDHTFGSIVPVVAVTLGAEIVEKHFTLDRDLGGPDAAFSMEPDEFRQMVQDDRAAESAVGAPSYEVTQRDRLRRRSLFVTRDLHAGQILTRENVRSVRPGHGLAPRYLDEVLGRKVTRDLARGTPLSFDDIAQPGANGGEYE